MTQPRLPAGEFRAVGLGWQFLLGGLQLDLGKDLGELLASARDARPHWEPTRRPWRAADPWRGETGSAVWPCLHAHTHGAARRDGLRAATRPQAAGWPDRVQLHLRSIAQCRPLPLARTLARSSFFFRRLRIIHRDRATFAFAQSVAGATPGACLLEAVARLMQHLTNRAGSHLRQAFLAQGTLQRFQRPGGRAILLTVGRTLHFLQDERSLGAAVGRLATSTGGNRERPEPMLIEAHDQLAHAVSTLQVSLMGGLGKGPSLSHRQHGFGSTRDIHWLAGCF